MFSAQISVPFLVLVTCRSILALSLRFGKIQKSKMADPRWPPFGNHGRITTLNDVITSRCGQTIYPLSVTVIAFILLKLWRGQNPPFPRPHAEDQKKPDLDSVKAETAEFGQVNRIHLDNFSYKLNFVTSLNFKLALTHFFFTDPSSCNELYEKYP